MRRIAAIFLAIVLSVFLPVIIPLVALLDRAYRKRLRAAGGGGNGDHVDQARSHQARCLAAHEAPGCAGGSDPEWRCTQVDFGVRDDSFVTTAEDCKKILSMLVRSLFLR